MVNLEIARAGMARVLSIEPNLLYDDLFDAAVSEARAERRGMFADALDAAVPLDEQREVAGGAARTESSDRLGVALRVHCINYNPSTDMDENAEWVEIEVLAPTDTRGLYLFDRGSKERFGLPPGVKKPGLLRIRNQGQGVWNNSGDTVVLRDDQQVIDEWEYEPVDQEDRPVCRD
jgi:hypothetical protein